MLGARKAEFPATSTYYGARHPKRLAAAQRKLYYYDYTHRCFSQKERAQMSCQGGKKTP